MRMHLERLHQLMAQNVSGSPRDGTYRIHPVTRRRNVLDSPGYTATEHIGFTRLHATERIGFTRLHGDGTYRITFHITSRAE